MDDDGNIVGWIHGPLGGVHVGRQIPWGEIGTTVNNVRKLYNYLTTPRQGDTVSDLEQILEDIPPVE